MTEFLKAAVIGYPVGHSLSPVIHNYWIAKYGIAGSYEARAVAPENLETDVRALFDGGYTGLNVTLPHKQTIMALCERLNSEAQEIGAANTLRRDEDGKIYGINTDSDGFIESIRESAPAFDLRRGPVLVLGAGGAARAVICGLLRAGAPEVRVVNRTTDRAAALAVDYDLAVSPWEDRLRAAQDIAMLVNTTSLGMKGQPPLDFDIGVLPETTLVCDIVYNPLRTPLIDAATARGLSTVGGLGMLLHQARLAFNFWTGVMPEIDDGLRAKLAEAMP